ncbi:MAG: HAD-IIIA family hydrolase [Smithella sp.]
MDDFIFNNYNYNKKLKPLAGNLRRNMTKAEACLWKYALKAKQLKGYQFRRQRPVLNYIADFICKELMLIIEIDGITHDSEVSLAKDKKREEELSKAGFKIIRFNDEEVLRNIEGVISKIEEEIEIIEKSTPLIPRQRGTKKATNGEKENYKSPQKSIAVFIDRDGTINEEVGYLDSADKLKIIPAAYKAIKLINENGMKAVAISNQSGIGRGILTEEFVILMNKTIQLALKEKGALIEKFYYCPHHPKEAKGIYLQVCNCRKPSPGMLLQASEELNIDLVHSYFIGDRLNDIETGKKVGAKGILVRTGYGTDTLQNKGPDREKPENKPDFIAADILEAVQWILQDRKQSI